MKVLRIVATVAVVALLACVLAARPVGTSASTAPPPYTGPITHGVPAQSAPHTAGVNTSVVTGAAYDIEGYNYYCTGGGTSCLTNSGVTSTYDCWQTGISCSGLNYANAESYGPFNGTTLGVPVQIEVECAKFYSWGYTYIGDYVYSSADMWYNIDDLGTIAGKSALFPASDPTLTGSEDNSSQTSSQDFSVLDPNYFRASVTGTQNTDNSTDDLNAGSFSLTFTGWIDRFSTSGSYLSSYYGTMSCLAGGTHGMDIPNSGITTEWEFEGEMEGGDS